ncbi:MAG TPA: hypothetical protein VNE39_14965 [Planctomycetota bacterium]|nr:hypothetical protein [Planctomycetota bacterium]
MGEVMTMGEIEARFDSEWVLLEDPVTDENLIRSGRLLCHSKDRDDVYRKAFELRPKHSAIFYVGAIPEDTVVVL